MENLEIKKVHLNHAEEFGKKAYLENVQVGHWYKFCTMISAPGEDVIGYGKVVAVNGDGTVDVVKFFKLPSYRPYAAPAWYDRLPYAI